MLFTIIIIIVLIFSIVNGYHHGLVNELFSFISYLIAAVIAFVYVIPVADFLRSASNMILATHAYTNTGFWRGLSFLITFVIVAVVLRWVSHLLNRIASLPVLRQLNSLLGAVVGAIISLLVMMLILDGLLLTNNDWVNTEYQNSTVSQMITMDSPHLFNQMINR
ncbi:CvpA family protein [Fructilactobacillus fructivorans]|uniref:Putative membrane ancor connecting MutS2 with cell-division Z-ring n=1 Tax=Fructilactobacillus fructivorans TaxID=1614 RepID=A0A0C1Q108_9LACO|nr:CvpA family protein [Fructilactobacillus fructivorans]KID41548.1 putative membrane ancor connecting MutS2 with cell-division Z-ring [Fructilactobacillus fructivorans]MCT0151199.1 CvpA family protein [Fructilactobacillus fructivorans]MCT2867724.1 CvpA family protein [Fructilactobacillus fructivorans]MCT2868758.1 CvpA family protein [Fructilactobacillus fructivorans]MCT2874072.1 CvpA family protein [Fructilactobacillus fructivorans]